jgi:catechol 2,3-dioxygenase-like lactoylglutathione lyase family enzyme
MKHTLAVTSGVVFVSELNRSLEFYRDVFGFAVAIHDREAALLLAQGGFQLYLIGRGSRAQHSSGGVGLQYLIWSTDDGDELGLLAEALKDHGVHTETYTSGAVTFLEARDPDGIRVVIAHPSPTERPRSVLGARLYSW